MWPDWQICLCHPFPNGRLFLAHRVVHHGANLTRPGSSRSSAERTGRGQPAQSAHLQGEPERRLRRKHVERPRGGRSAWTQRTSRQGRRLIGHLGGLAEWIWQVSSEWDVCVTILGGVTGACEPVGRGCWAEAAGALCESSGTGVIGVGIAPVA